MSLAMGVTTISAAQWLRCTVVASGVLWFVEVEKLFRRLLSKKHMAIAHSMERLAGIENDIAGTLDNFL
jgi:hypothetical protein